MFPFFRFRESLGVALASVENGRHFVFIGGLLYCGVVDVPRARDEAQFVQGAHGRVHVPDLSAGIPGPGNGLLEGAPFAVVPDLLSKRSGAKCQK